MITILQARIQQYMNWELPDVQAGFRKGRGTRDQIANICCIKEMAKEFQKNIYFCLTTWKPLTVWITTNCGKFFKRWEYQTTWLASVKNMYAGQKEAVRTVMEQQIGSKLGKQYVKPVYYHPAYLTYMQSTSCKMPGWIKHKLKSRLLGENINNLRHANNTILTAESEEELKSLLMKVKEESEKVCLKLNIQKTKIMASSHITSWQIDGEKMETLTILYFLELQNHCRWWLQPWH